MSLQPLFIYTLADKFFNVFVLYISMIQRQARVHNSVLNQNMLVFVKEITSENTNGHNDVRIKTFGFVTVPPLLFVR